MPASSFSRNGMSAVATDTSCLGDTSMKSTWSAEASMISSLKRLAIFGFTKDPSLRQGLVGLRDDVAVFNIGGEIHYLVGDFAAFNLAVRGFDEPVSLIRA